MATHNGSLKLPLSLLSALALAACGAGDKPREEGAGGGANATSAANEAAPAVDLANAATVTGKITFEGAPPAAKPIDMAEEPTCAAKHPAGAKGEEVVVNENGTLRNVFVYVKEGLGDKKFPASKDPVIIDQDGCVYHPRVAGVQVGQPLMLRNSDGILHNINAKPSKNRGFNVSQPTKMESSRTFTAPEVMVPIACDVHGWMHAYVAVLDHPYFGVSNETGTFSLAQLPPGDYVIEAWHERYGAQTMKVTVAARETKTIEFHFKAAAAELPGTPGGNVVATHGSHPAEHGGL
jgi:plastocyanin